ncbi:MAG: aromatic amino acid lyase [Acidobacteriota bacterium]
MSAVVLDGRSLTLETLAAVARDPATRVTLDPAALERVRRGREQIEAIVERYREGWRAYREGGERPMQDYGVTTGFGEFKNVPLAADELEGAQENILRSHMTGIGDTASLDDPGNVYPAEVVRATLVIRINAFLRGHSGVRVALVEQLVRLLHRGIVPAIPTKGSLGSSGDLCPLSHCFGILVGAGHYWRVESVDELHRPPKLKPATELATDLGEEPLMPVVKEGLALINGATVSAALLGLAVVDATNLTQVADRSGALSFEAACGCARAYDPIVHEARGQIGQIDVAAHIRELMTGSTLVDSANDVQDPYSLRCMPAVHGSVRDALGFVRGIAEREINAATDNPLFFPDRDDTPWNHGFADNWPGGYQGETRASYSAGNFHGQPVAMAADILCLAIAELANIAERRVQLLLDRNHNRNLPSNLVPHRGVHSGLMLAQYSAASLVAENKVLCHPASVDSIPTGANIEDHIANATVAARKLRTVIGNVEAVLAIELMVAAQAVDWRVGLGFKPSPGADDRRPAMPGDHEDAMRDEADDFAKAVADPEAIATKLGQGTAEVYRFVRRQIPTLQDDRVLADDIRVLRQAIQDRS